MIRQLSKSVKRFPSLILSLLHNHVFCAKHPSKLLQQRLVARNAAAARISPHPSRFNRAESRGAKSRKLNPAPSAGATARRTSTDDSAGKRRTLSRPTVTRPQRARKASFAARGGSARIRDGSAAMTSRASNISSRRPSHLARVPITARASASFNSHSTRSASNSSRVKRPSTNASRARLRRAVCRAITRRASASSARIFSGRFSSSSIVRRFVRTSWRKSPHRATTSRASRTCRSASSIRTDTPHAGQR